MIKINKFSQQTALHWTITKVGHGIMGEVHDDLFWGISKNTNRAVEDDLDDRLMKFVKDRFRIK